ncbi:hypothetical protein ABIB15_002528 [Marisediminicola sp. UYEF4]
MRRTEVTHPRPLRRSTVAQTNHLIVDDILREVFGAVMASR